jgi:hypothetical protein
LWIFWFVCGNKCKIFLLIFCAALIVNHSLCMEPIHGCPDINLVVVKQKATSDLIMVVEINKFCEICINNYECLNTINWSKFSGILCVFFN